ncbi:MAG: 2-oxoglutarate dehydrogenase complex dihydrolipoyllysine-residue succinyltransferase [Alphaproteobacteria bacterium]|nr:2-oxoglutarate dehydrogenase complex dihydrolipoyllysine-residue succinyltransferase [Alphaproteobacteria bacterium]MBV9586717.1 2-oxoglutarate dehydrogenase complex dihydrolipoyllysine-residue succinyltransferase [Alphaproteobacteria bacterium]MBV9966788.1 2-oxoglutarate dehydrogenase complex dihydrolipoyllysine-residue succinyltransferase [Alphaproteobacteria bacterium]
MTIEITVPTLGESVTEATVAKWLKQPGEPIERDEPVVELETDKVTLEVPAPAGGTLGEIRAAEGANVPVGAVLGIIADGAAGSPHPPAAAAAGRPSPAVREGKKAPSEALERAGPAVRKLLAESGLDVARVTPTGRGGRITKADVIAARDQSAPAPVKEPPAEPAPPPPRERREPPQPVKEPPTNRPPVERETRVRMTRLRRRIAERLKEAQQNAAMLTTFNEIDMSGAIGLRERWREAFEKKHGVRLGFMPIFVKAAIIALKELPAVNAEIDGDDLVYKNHYDIGVAVGTEQGLVVPVVRDADKKSFAEIETEIGALGRKARDGKLTIEDLSGGTFTISNGGVYGSLLSTPILNPPQSAILGMHKIERRPIAVGDHGNERIEIRPMMYVALTYDHRIIDGREAVTFLVRIKECVEDPSRLLFDI